MSWYLYFGYSYFALAMFFFGLIWFECSNLILNANFINYGLEFLDFSVFLDSFSCYFLWTLFSILSSVAFFCYSYMSAEINHIRFLMLLSLFVFSMSILIIAPNLISFVLGWDGLGFTSFLLVAWFGSYSSYLASLKTFLTNRLGDSFLLVSIAFLFTQGHFGFMFFDSYLSGYLVLFLILASCTKSAQWPFSSWLPLAMEAPTPVSALVHSSTLVTSGVYFLVRFNSYLSSQSLFCISVLGLFTMFFSSICAFLEFDSKKIIAYSTLSQLGFMFLCIGSNLASFCLFYLLVHASFKALMFISVGMYISFNGHNQDLRSLNSLWSFSPLAYLNVLVSVFSLSGIPFLSCFIFKHQILYSLSSNVFNALFSLSTLFCIILSCLYSFRLFSISSLADICYSFGISPYSSNSFMYFPLYLNSLLTGYLLWSPLVRFYNVSFDYSVFILCLLALGIMSGIYVLDSFIEALQIYLLVSSMFYCQYFSVSFNSIFLSGSNLFLFLDKGMFSSEFIERISTLFSENLNSIYSVFSSVSWIGLLLFSYMLILFIILL